MFITSRRHYRISDNITADTGWDLMLRVALCYMVFYASLYFALGLVNGLPLAQLLFGVPAPTASMVWLKFACEFGARLGAAAMLVGLGVPRYRFAQLQDGQLYTRFSRLFPVWLTPVAMLSVVTTLGQLTPLAHPFLVWMGFHAFFAYTTMHYLMHGVADDKKLRLIEV